MQAAIRSSVLSGATLLTAGVVAVAPVHPLPQLEAAGHAASSAAVHLTSSVIDYYQQVLSSTGTNLQTLFDTAKDIGPFPILQQVGANQLAALTGVVDALGEAGGRLANSLNTTATNYMKAASAALADGNIEDALNNVLMAVVAPLLAAVDLTNADATLLPSLETAFSQPLQNTISVIKNLPEIVLELGVAVIGPLASGIGGFGAAVQNILDAAHSGDLGKVATAVLEAPATMFDGLVNGGYGPNIGPLVGLDIPGFNIYAGGLLGTGGVVAGGSALYGTIGTLQSLIKELRAWITPEKATTTKALAATSAVSAISASLTTAEAATVPATGATTVTLSTTGTDSTPAASTDAAASSKGAANATSAPATADTVGTTASGDTKATADTSAAAGTTATADSTTSTATGSATTATDRVGKRQLGKSRPTTASGTQSTHQQAGQQKSSATPGTHAGKRPSLSKAGAGSAR
ncbi:MAG TPA: hypothetical protein VFW21_00210 [Mycobacterium sp.]|nr:hypothetical protein [Mycobacterium sp.]